MSSEATGGAHEGLVLPPQADLYDSLRGLLQTQPGFVVRPCLWTRARLSHRPWR